MYDNLYKYPRSYHFPWSLSLMNDDRKLPSTSVFEGKRVIVSEKMDGENTTFTRTLSHARSLDSANHPSRDWSKQFHGTFSHDIPEGWRVCAENVYATHSIKYRKELGNALPHFVIGLSVWDDTNTALSWDDTIDWFKLFGITPPHIFYDGVYDEAYLKQLAKDLNPELVEGYVVRVADAMPYEHFFSGVAKYVRAKHVGNNPFWRTQEIVPNETV